MEILIAGNRDKIGKKRFFSCPDCGAVWSAYEDEYDEVDNGDGIYYTCKCPTQGCVEKGVQISKEIVDEKLGYTIMQQTLPWDWYKKGENNWWLYQPTCLL